MLSISNSALEAAKKINGVFVVTSTPINCSCTGGVRRNLTVTLQADFKNVNNTYREFEYEGVKVFISKALTLSENITIYQSAKIPFLGPVFASKGIHHIISK